MTSQTLTMTSFYQGGYESFYQGEICIILSRGNLYRSIKGNMFSNVPELSLRKLMVFHDLLHSTITTKLHSINEIRIWFLNSNTQLTVIVRC